MLRKIIDSFLYGVNLILAILLLFACLTPYISVATLPILSIFSLFVPLLVLSNLFFLVYWVFRLKKALWLSLFVLGISYFFIGSFIQFRASRPLLSKAQDISVMSFNARLFNKYQWSKEASIPNQIAAFVKKNNPDIVCFQEFEVSRKNDFKQYPYAFLSANDNSKQAVQAIFSKYPIQSKGVIPFPNSTNTAIYTDLDLGKNRIRIYNIHLQSLRFKPEVSSLSLDKRERLYKRLKVSFAKQQAQAELIAAHKDQSPYKAIISGDFNTNQFSSVYHKIKGDFKDSFTEAGSGFGTSFNFKYFPLRIDFILSDPIFEVIYHKNFKGSLSDHYPILGVFTLK